MTLSNQQITVLLDWFIAQLIITDVIDPVEVTSIDLTDIDKLLPTVLDAVNTKLNEEGK